MEFVLQPPGTAKLLDAINRIAGNADSGGGAFAFASKGGIDALFESPNITHMLKNGKPFNLIIGIDAITNAEALLYLHDKLNLFPKSLSVKVFYHENPNSIFHPKFCWFKQGNTLRLVTGSGNLTLRGLGQATNNTPPPGNWEAFSVQSLTGSKAIAVQTEINRWLTEHRDAGTLRTHDDEQVRDRAMANGRVRFASLAVKTIPAPLADAPTTSAPATLIDGVVLSTPEILIREVPQNRSGQADVGRSALEEFFGYDGEAKHVLVQHVSLDNILGSVDSIRLFVNKSSNYRLELHAIAELQYEIHDDGSRMILVASKLDHRSFRYSIVPVTDENYIQVVALLGPVPPTNKRQRRRMREIRVTTKELLAAWSRAPSHLLPVELPTPEP